MKDSQKSVFQVHYFFLLVYGLGLKWSLFVQKPFHEVIYCQVNDIANFSSLFHVKTNLNPHTYISYFRKINHVKTIHREKHSSRSKFQTVYFKCRDFHKVTTLKSIVKITCSRIFSMILTVLQSKPTCYPILNHFYNMECTGMQTQIET